MNIILGITLFIALFTILCIAVITVLQEEVEEGESFTKGEPNHEQP